MADLDNFFAKKDKKKKKSTTLGFSKANTEVIVKKDEEWYDYDPDEKDYTGLKIEALQIQDELSKDEETKTHLCFFKLSFTSLTYYRSDHIQQLGNNHSNAKSLHYLIEASLVIQ
ncbi:unnamed protein product [Lepeophtheirus salmonis]|uniref:(salmon louse) hypothetical protein n=1 Tax=Lepeophtheirus salmonis TaxID=72036 RepID=A0A7R8CCW8_LEPSM|nr:unnamed protein product [Lepeophtheirus salmonis]CAF2773800.1 unnamed protein product [Lepeophtheirus salmonis]